MSFPVGRVEAVDGDLFATGGGVNKFTLAQINPHMRNRAEIIAAKENQIAGLQMTAAHRLCLVVLFF